MSKGISYLEDNFLPMILTITPTKSKSHIYSFLGLERNSTQSILIQLGDRIEKFWNTTGSHSPYVKNLIETNNMINVAGKLKQVDHHFERIDDGCRIYLEGKCNLNFDSEKTKASNDKVENVKNALNADVGAYFVPVVREIPKKDLVKYNNKGIQVYGVNYMINLLKPPFDSDDYFYFGREVMGPILEEKGL